MMRRVVAIFLKFTRSTGHLHPHPPKFSTVVFYGRVKFSCKMAECREKRSGLRLKSSFNRISCPSLEKVCCRILAK